MATKTEIIYTIISYDKKTFLCDYSPYSGNFQLNCLKILKTVKSNHCASIDYNIYKFNYIDNDGLTVLCLASNEFPLDSCYCFLKEVLEQFKKKIPMETIKQSNSHFELSSWFVDDLKAITEKFNLKPTESDNIALLKKEIINFKNNVLRADNILAERGEILQHIVIQSEKLKTESNTYYKSSKHVNRKAKCAKWMWGIFAFLALAIIAYFIAAFICGFKLDKCPSKEKSNNSNNIKNNEYFLISN